MGMGGVGVKWGWGGEVGVGDLGVLEWVTLEWEWDGDLGVGVGWGGGGGGGGGSWCEGGRVGIIVVIELGGCFDNIHSRSNQGKDLSPQTIASHE